MSECSKLCEIPTKTCLLLVVLGNISPPYVYLCWTEAYFEKSLGHCSARGFRWLIGWGGPSEEPG